MKNILIILLSLLFLASCAPRMMYSHPQTGRTNIDKDRQECEYEATKATAYYAPGLSGQFEQVMKKNQIVEMCMRNKGYDVVPNTLNDSKTE